MKRVILNRMYECAYPLKDHRALWVKRNPKTGDIVTIKRWDDSEKKWVVYLTTPRVGGQVSVEIDEGPGEEPEPERLA